MTKAIVKKLLSIILTLFFVSVLIFLVFQIIPGNPAEIILGTEGRSSPDKGSRKGAWA